MVKLNRSFAFKFLTSIKEGKQIFFCLSVCLFVFLNGRIFCNNWVKTTKLKEMLLFLQPNPSHLQQLLQESLLTTICIVFFCSFFFFFFSIFSLLEFVPRPVDVKQTKKSL